MWQEEIVLKVSYDEIDSVILEVLSRSPCSIYQLKSIIRLRLSIEVSYVKLVKKLEYLRFLGKVGRRRKNVRVFEYFILA